MTQNDKDVRINFQDELQINLRKYLGIKKICF